MLGWSPEEVERQLKEALIAFRTFLNN